MPSQVTIMSIYRKWVVILPTYHKPPNFHVGKLRVDNMSGHNA